MVWCETRTGNEICASIIPQELFMARLCQDWVKLLSNSLKWRYTVWWLVLETRPHEGLLGNCWLRACSWLTMGWKSRTLGTAELFLPLPSSSLLSISPTSLSFPTPYSWDGSFYSWRIEESGRKPCIFFLPSTLGRKSLCVQVQPSLFPSILLPVSETQQGCSALWSCGGLAF